MGAIKTGIMRGAVNRLLRIFRFIGSALARPFRGSAGVCESEASPGPREADGPDLGMFQPSGPPRFWLELIAQSPDLQWVESTDGGMAAHNLEPERRPPCGEPMRRTGRPAPEFHPSPSAAAKPSRSAARPDSFPADTSPVHKDRVKESPRGSEMTAGGDRGSAAWTHAGICVDDEDRRDSRHVGETAGFKDAGPDDKRDEHRFMVLPTRHVAAQPDGSTPDALPPRNYRKKNASRVFETTSAGDGGPAQPAGAGTCERRDAYAGYAREGRLSVDAPDRVPSRIEPAAGDRYPPQTGLPDLPEPVPAEAANNREAVDAGRMPAVPVPVREQSDGTRDPWLHDTGRFPRAADDGSGRGMQKTVCPSRDSFPCMSRILPAAGEEIPAAEGRGMGTGGAFHREPLRYPVRQDSGESRWPELMAAPFSFETPHSRRLDLDAERNERLAMEQKGIQWNV